MPGMVLKEFPGIPKEGQGMRRRDFCGPGKSARIMLVKEALVYVGREAGATNAALAKEMGLESSAVSRRYEAARKKMAESEQMSALVREVRRKLRLRGD